MFFNLFLIKTCITWKIKSTPWIKNRAWGTEILFLPEQNITTPIESTLPKLYVHTSIGVPFKKLYNEIPWKTNPPGDEISKFNFSYFWLILVSIILNNWSDGLRHYRCHKSDKTFFHNLLLLILMGIAYNGFSIKEVFAKQKFGWVPSGTNILCCVRWSAALIDFPIFSQLHYWFETKLYD